MAHSQRHDFSLIPVRFFICILGYSQNRHISFDGKQNENVSLQFLIRWSKLNHIPHIKQFEIPVYNLTADFIHLVGCKTKYLYG